MGINNELHAIVQEAVACSTVATERAMEKLDRGEDLEFVEHKPIVVYEKEDNIEEYI